MKKLISSILLSFLLLIPISSPVNSIDEVVALLEKYSSEYPTEKVYLHTAQPYFAKGEILWYKAYVVAGPHHIPSPISKTIYTELIDPSGKISNRQQVAILDGVVKGDIQLSDSLVAGTYTLRAYTNWMRNFDDEYYYEKKIEIVGTPTNSGISTGKKPVTNLNSVRFFPEGGDLVEELPSRVAFEISGFRATEGALFDSEGNTVTTFDVQSGNQGTFEFTPQPGETYHAEFGNPKEPYKLPTIKESGFTIQVDNLTDATNLHVQIASKNPDRKRLRVYLLLQTRGMMTYATEVGLAANLTRVDIPKSVLHQGITHITLFNDQFRPQAERLVYRHKDPEIKATITTDKSSYTPREQTVLTLKVSDKQGKPIAGNFSMSVFDSKQIQPTWYTENIASSLMISSDIPSGLASSISFLSSDGSKQQELDLLLMTKGWRRFNWKDLLENGIPEPKFRAEQGIKVTGTVMKKNGKPASGGKVSNIGKFAGFSTFDEAEVEDDGSFEFESLQFYGDNAFLRAKDTRGRENVILSIDKIGNPDIPKYVPGKGKSLGGRSFNSQFLTENEQRAFNNEAYDTDNINTFLQRNRERQSIDSAFNPDRVTDLGTVVIENSKNTQISANADRGFVFGRGEYTFNVSDMMSYGQKFRNALFILQGRVPGITITLSAISSEPIVQMNRKVWSFANPDPPILYIIDDTPVDLAAVTALPAEKIERVEVLKGMRASGIYGKAGNGGALVFYTKTAFELNAYNERLMENLAEEINNISRLNNGYYLARDFYSPDYSTKEPEHVKPDRRALIYWAPMIKTNENGEAELRFFNADLESDIYIQLEGLSDDGKPVVGSGSYVVSKLRQ